MCPSNWSHVTPDDPEGPDRQPADQKTSDGERPRRHLVQSRLAVSLLSAMTGVLAGSWAARAPDVRAAVGAGDTAWGLVNSAARVGTLLGLVVVLYLIGRTRTRRLSLIGATVFLVVAPLMAASPVVVLLGLGLMTWTFAEQLMDSPNWALKLEVQRRYRRPLLGTFVACWSFGNLAGGGISTAAAASGVSPVLQLAATSGLFGSLLLIGYRWLPHESRPASHGEQDRRPRIRDRFTPQLRLLATMRFLTIFMAAAAAQWAAIYTADTLGAGSTLGAATYAAMSLANAVALLAVGRLMARFNQRRFFQLSTTAAAAGLACALLVGTPEAAIAGFVILGLGTACIDPLVYGLAGQQPGLTAGESVSVVETGELPGGLISAAMIGLLAGEFGLRIALVTVVLAVLALPVLAQWTKPSQRADEPLSRPQASH